MYIQGTAVNSVSGVRLILDTKLNRKTLGQEYIEKRKKTRRWKSFSFVYSDSSREGNGKIFFIISCYEKEHHCYVKALINKSDP